QAQLRGDLPSSTCAHPLIDFLRVVDDFRNRAIETEEPIRQVQLVAGFRESAHSADEVGAAAADYDVEWGRSVAAEMLAQRVSHRSEGFVDVGVIRFAACE